MRSVLFTALFSLAWSFVLSATAEERTVFLVQTFPSRLNLATGSDPIASMIRTYVAPGLVASSDHGTFVPAGADKFRLESAGWFFFIDAGASFQNGEDVTQQDLESSLSECKIEHRTITALDGSYEIMIPAQPGSLAQSVLQRVSQCPLYPQELKEAFGVAWGESTHFDGLGGWRVARHEAGKRVTLEREHAIVEFLHHGDVDLAWRRLRSGEVEGVFVAGAVPDIIAKDATISKTDCDGLLLLSRGGSEVRCSMNPSPGIPPLVLPPLVHGTSITDSW